MTTLNMSLQPRLENPNGHADTDSVQNYLSEEHAMNSPKNLSNTPPESFWLSKDSERDWFHQNAAMERKTSLKFAFSGKTNKKSKLFSHHSFSSLNQKSKTSFFAVPKTRKSLSSDGFSRVNKAAKFRFSRSRSEPGRKMMMKVAEPGSPKVSCTGRVRSKSKKDKEIIRTGFWKKVMKAVLKNRSGSKGDDSVRTTEPAGLKRMPTRRWSES